MEYVSLENVSKSYGEKVLFENISYQISKGDKVALIARNGSGKSTLLRMIAGHDSPEGERSKINVAKNVRVGYLEQEPQIDGGKTIEQIYFDFDHPALKAIRRYNDAESRDDSALMSEAMNELDDLDAWDFVEKGKEILFKLNLRDLNQPVASLSGGQKKRLALAQLIISEPQFLILDEPTNHLDIDMIEWLENYLNNPSLTILMVTHDRYFLERICTEIVELDRGHLYVFRGNYSSYLEKKSLRSSIENTTYNKAKNLLVKELEWIKRQPKARGTKAKSRVDKYYKLKDEVSSISFEEVFEIEVDSQRLGSKILEFYDSKKSYDDKVLFEEFWYKFKKGERVGICGPNGSGKSSLVKIMVGDLKLSSGKRVAGETIQFGLYSQDGIALDKDMRVIDVIRSIAEYIPLKKGQRISAAKLLENFMFSRDQQQVYVSQLSGGEKKRLHLLTILADNPNFLVLDEPTNDLDVLTLNVLENYLLRFTGCLVIVSHDRYFMDKLVDHMFILPGNGKIEDFNGNYSEWKVQESKTKRKPKKLSRQTKMESVQGSKKNLSYLEKKEMQDIEIELKSLESRKKNIEAQFITENIPAAQITKLSIELGEINSRIEKCEYRWLELSEFL